MYVACLFALSVLGFWTPPVPTPAPAERPGLRLASKAGQMGEPVIYGESVEEAGVSGIENNKGNFFSRAFEIWWLIFILPVSAGFMILGFIFRNSRGPAESDAAVRQKLLRTQMNPHFIFNCLNSIQHLFVTGDRLKGMDYVADFGSLLREILEITGEEEISLCREIHAVELYLQLEKARLGNTLNYRISIGPDLDLDEILVPPLIIQPLVENAIWHGIVPKKEPGCIGIQINKAEKGVLVEIEDDGIGYKRSLRQKNVRPGHISKGMSITRERLSGKGAIKYSPARPKAQSFPGTRVSVTLFSSSKGMKYPQDPDPMNIR